MVDLFKYHFKREEVIMVLAALAVFRSIKTAKENLKYAIFEGDV